MWLDPGTPAIIGAGSSGNFSASRIDEGHYRITSDDFNTNTVIIATCTRTGVTIGAHQGATANSLDVFIARVADAASTNAWFNFVAFTR